MIAPLSWYTKKLLYVCCFVWVGSNNYILMDMIDVVAVDRHSAFTSLPNLDVIEPIKSRIKQLKMVIYDRLEEK